MDKPYYQDDLAVIYHGDATDVLPMLPEKIVALICTDPPYFQPATHYVPARGEREIRTLGDTSVLLHAYRAWAHECERVLEDTGSAYFFCDGQSYPITYQAFYALGRVRPLIWDKITSFNGYTWRHQHEFIAWVERPGAVRVPTGDGDILRYRAVKVSDRIHPAEKPQGLISALLAKHEAGPVLDPFMGSGTTLRAAKDLGRRSIGIEIEERYCEIAAKRLSQQTLDFGAERLG